GRSPGVPANPWTRQESSLQRPQHSRVNPSQPTSPISVTDSTPAPADSTSPASRPALIAAILTGVVAQALVILWIAASEIPARVFISSWSVSMPGILIVAALLLAARVVSPAVRQ